MDISRAPYKTARQARESALPCVDRCDDGTGAAALVWSGAAPLAALRLGRVRTGAGAGPTTTGATSRCRHAAVPAVPPVPLLAVGVRLALIDADITTPTEAVALGSPVAETAVGASGAVSRSQRLAPVLMDRADALTRRLSTVPLPGSPLPHAAAGAAFQVRGPPASAPGPALAGRRYLLADESGEPEGSQQAEDRAPGTAMAQNHRQAVEAGRVHPDLLQSRASLRSL